MTKSLQTMGHFCVPIALAVVATYITSSDVQKSIKDDVVPWLQVAAFSTTTVNQGLQAAKQLRRSK
ncbi:hypothetical protein BJP36_12270 [Moorena producens JHB]|uniref:Holin n=1 Tax=Moorena producens (strain JHB) TaxID=1454205 RepID=A0A1D9FZJ1_MOOP1|nr:hypothetical protein [Moorena producens]AOY80580.1 hypothetical protein BJP36_12270 [Moorena producens JHB]